MERHAMSLPFLYCCSSFAPDGIMATEEFSGQLRRQGGGGRWRGVALYMILWYLFYLFATLASLSGYDH
jgi:hypothetical protein